MYWEVRTNECYDYYLNKYICSPYNEYYIRSELNGVHYRLGRGWSYYGLRGNDAAVAGQVGFRRRLDWEEVWGSLTAYDPYYNSYEKLDVEDYAWESQQSRWTFQQAYSTASEADAQMLAACSAAKQDNNVLVYTIAFSAPTSAQTLLHNCATPGRDYVGDTNTIGGIFEAIGVSVQKLKLTQ